MTRTQCKVYDYLAMYAVCIHQVVPFSFIALRRRSARSRSPPAHGGLETFTSSGLCTFKTIQKQGLPTLRIAAPSGEAQPQIIQPAHSWTVTAFKGGYASCLPTLTVLQPRV